MSISKTIILGNLGKAPEIRSTQNGKMVGSFSVATSKKWKDQNGEKQEKTSWHNIICFGSLVKVCEYLDKGSIVYLEGELDYGEYTNKEGQKAKTTNILATRIEIIKGKEKSENKIDQHSIDKGNGYQPDQEEQDNDSDSIPF